MSRHPVPWIFGVVQILAHRGLSTTPAADNTIPAISAAFAAGADGVEVDLRLSADGVLVACHDTDLNRVGGPPLEVRFTPWERLRRGAEKAGMPLARIEWVLAAAAGRPVVLELKPGPARTATVLVERLIGLQSAGLPLDVTVSSFDAALVRAFRETVPVHLGTRTALLGRPRVWPLRRSGRLRGGLRERPVAVARTSSRSTTSGSARATTAGRGRAGGSAART